MRFSSGTLVLADGRRVPAHRFGAMADEADAKGIALEGDLRRKWTVLPRDADHLELRPYQKEALERWERVRRRGILALPTGAGKTRVAIAAILTCGLPALILCPTRVLLRSWVRELTSLIGERIGAVGDGATRVERITVMTFESAYRRLHLFGDRFGLLVVDEAHHFASGLRAEALETSAAIARLGLSATAPPSGSEGAARLRELIGPVAMEVPVEDLVGTHLAPLDIVELPVELEPEEREEYEAKSGPFIEARRMYFREHRFADYNDMLRDFGRYERGRQLLRDWSRATRLACFPRAKRVLIESLLQRHKGDRSIVFTAHVDDAYSVAEQSLIPVITGEVGARERQRILTQFKAGTLRAIASARVLNEGVDVPDARVAIVASSSLGVREHVQRIGRVLRPAPGKTALVYELITRGTVDERIAAGRRARPKAD
jgi:superfamily II DNA or RNA helicase